MFVSTISTHFKTILVVELMLLNFYLKRRISKFPPVPPFENNAIAFLVFRMCDIYIYIYIYIYICSSSNSSNNGSIHTHTHTHKQRDQQQTRPCTLTAPTSEGVNNVLLLVYRNVSVRACAKQAFKLFFFALFTDKVISRKRTTTLQAVTCCVCACVSQYSWRTCLGRTQGASSRVGGGAKFLASYLVKLRG